jgi:hypothetical protein
VVDSYRDQTVGVLERFTNGLDSEKG